MLDTAAASPSVICRDPSASSSALSGNPFAASASWPAPAASWLVPSLCSFAAPLDTLPAPTDTWLAPSCSWLAPAASDCVPAFSVEAPPTSVPRPASRDDAPETRLPRPASSESAPSLSVPRFDVMAALPSFAVIRPSSKSPAPSAAVWMSLPESATRESTVCQYSSATVSLTRWRTSFHTVSPIWEASMFSLWLYSILSCALRGASLSADATLAEKSDGMVQVMKYVPSSRPRCASSADTKCHCRPSSVPRNSSTTSSPRLRFSAATVAPASSFTTATGTVFRRAYGS